MSPRTSVFSLSLLVWSVLAVGRAEPVQLVSGLDPGQGAPAGGSGDSSLGVLSPDGRFVLYASTANNLVLTTNNTPIPTRFPAALNVYLYDRTNHTTSLVSVNITGQGGGNGDSLPANLSSDGRYVLFESAASDLIANDTNNVSDVFLRDLANGSTILVSASTNGVAANGASRNPVMTPDAHFVAFVSAANNLVRGDTNRIPDVFVRDILAGTTVLASVGAVSTNTTTLAGSSEAPDITPDGRYVAFFSTATNLVKGVPAGGDIYVRDLVAGTNIWASRGARGAVLGALQSTTAASYNFALSADGQFVAFEAGQNPSSVGVILRYSLTTGLTELIHTNAAVNMGALEEARSLDMTPDGRFVAFVANTNGNSGANTCLCVWDAQSSAITVASLDLNGQVPSVGTCDWPTLTPDGRFVAFASNASNLTANATSGTYHFYVRDLQSSTTALLDADPSGLGSTVSPATVPRLSADGQWAVFDAADGNLAANDRNHATDIFVRDMVAGSTELISAHSPNLSSVSPNGASSLGSSAISADGRYVAFASEADNLVANDTNGCRDIFLRDFGATATILVSVNTNGSTGHGPSSEPALSGDGRWVAFTSAADDLVIGDTNRAQDVFVRDLQMGTTLLVSLNSGSTGPGNKASYSPALSSDGRYVLFRSQSSNLAAGMFSGENLFVRDLSSSTTYALSTGGVAVAAMPANGSVVAFIGRTCGSTVSNFYVWSSQSHTLAYTNSVDPLASYRNLVASRDGQRFAYSTSGALSLVDLQAGTNRVIDSALAASYPGIRFTRDGLFLGFTKTLGPTNQLCLYELAAGTVSVLSQASRPPGLPLGSANALDISPDGRFLVYRSSATNSLPNPSNNLGQLFVFDRQTGTSLLLTANVAGNVAADNFSTAPSFSEDAQSLLFQSWSSDLVTGDFNQSGDIFLSSFLYLAISQTSDPTQGPTLSWPAVPGGNYRIEYTDRLPDGTWQELNATITNFANKIWLQDPTPRAGQRYYRVSVF